MDAHEPTTPTLDPPAAGFAVGGRFVEALAQRDFGAMADCLDPDIRFRALLPARDVDVSDRDAMVAEFRRWFGREDEALEMLDATVGQVGPHLYLRWRIRMVAPDKGRVVEQHAYVDADERIGTMSLMCSGFVADIPA